MEHHRTAKWAESEYMSIFHLMNGPAAGVIDGHLKKYREFKNKESTLMKLVNDSIDDLKANIQNNVKLQVCRSNEPAVTCDYTRMGL